MTIWMHTAGHIHAVHQAATFSSNPRQSRDNAIKRIGEYLKGTAEKGIIYDPNSEKVLEVYVDADFAGNYDSANAEDPALVH